MSRKQQQQQQLAGAGGGGGSGGPNDGKACCIAQVPATVGLRAPTFDADGNFYVAFSLRGTIMKAFAGGDQDGEGKQTEGGMEFEEVANTGGQPMAMAFMGPEGPTEDGQQQILVADTAHGAILAVRPGSQPRAATGDSSNRDNASSAASADEEGPQMIVQEYEGKPFWGPSHITYDRVGNMYFTDSGPFGETTLQQPNGSLYCITTQQILRPILYECLAHPSAVTVGSSDNEIFMAELMSNRILRLVQRPGGVFHCSVFHQFNGKLGPTSLVYHPGKDALLVARYDFSQCSNTGTISMIHGRRGNILREWEIPGAEITGIAISPVDGSIVCTEYSQSSIYQLK